MNHAMQAPETSNTICFKNSKLCAVLYKESNFLRNFSNELIFSSAFRNVEVKVKNEKTTPYELESRYSIIS